MSSGFSVTCCFGNGKRHGNTPGRYTSQPRIAPRLAHTTNSACCAKPPRRSRMRPSVLSHTATPRRIKPAACTTSVSVGSWRQSMKLTSSPPGFNAQRHSLSQA
ncbi:Uncharacterised protein [Burkholderia pseudomallei]|nr:Uncharacterised protein [Burkholderia pseudomallei]CAJ5210921.1 Uncharacterised protein [Burkholderia pseudomallei]